MTIVIYSQTNFDDILRHFVSSHDIQNLPFHTFSKKAQPYHYYCVRARDFQETNQLQLELELSNWNWNCQIGIIKVDHGPSTEWNIF
jgi:hypothetical protein